MYILVVSLFVIELLYHTQRVYTLQFNGDLNRVLSYLQKQQQKYNGDNDRDSLEVTFQESSRNGDFNSAFKTYSQDDTEKRVVSETSDVTHPTLDVNDLANILSYKKQNSDVPKPKKNRFHSNFKNNDNVQEYSKVYLVLDPQANINTADVKRIGEIVSSLISSKGKFQTIQKLKAQPRRYKGFALMDDVFSRRRNRDSKEKFSKDSIERDYKPKRARSEYGGGGGGGRTAIPYIRHRGDIYEKE